MGGDPDLREIDDAGLGVEGYEGGVDEGRAGVERPGALPGVALREAGAKSCGARISGRPIQPSPTVGQEKRYSLPT